MKNTIIILLALLIVCVGGNSHLYAGFGDTPSSSAKKSSKDKVSQIKKGMTEAQVRKILGDPDSEEELNEHDGDGGGVLWLYHLSKTDEAVKDTASGVASSAVGSALASVVPFGLGAATTSAGKATDSATGNKSKIVTIKFKNGKVLRINQSTRKK